LGANASDGFGSLLRVISICEAHDPALMSTTSVIRRDIVVNGRSYEVYTGFLTAQEINNYARVPKFEESKSHYNIAKDLLTTPVDEWQRPQDNDKIQKISQLYSKTNHDNVMPNGILLGVDDDCIEEFGMENCNCEIEPLTVGDGVPVPVPGIYQMKLTSDGINKPLLILDGQHRILGMSRSSQYNQPVPFVLCSGPNFTGQVLAEIFTHVTTEATPMKQIHKDWMQYSFHLGPYTDEARHSAGTATVRLCTEPTLLNEVNIFHKKIKFNDYINLPMDEIRGGFNQDKLTFIGISQRIARSFYSNLDAASYPDPIDVAASISTFIRAVRNVTTDASESKFFTTDQKNKYHSILCEELLDSFLHYLSKNTQLMDNSLSEWQDFLTAAPRHWDKAVWKLPYVESLGQNASDLKKSRKVVENCFQAFFNDPSNLYNVRMHQYLK
jgi:hypothetical protein